MIQQAISHFRYPQLTCLGLLLFLGVFLGAVSWVFRKNSGDFYHSLEQLPLQESQPQVHLTREHTGEIK